ncbi:MAG: class I SAM-dependent methyltransferase [Candidatus Omnitrophica bacterium]|nr:class I SAM-dependent methyltransferase [Candidatus Omnitrophota bacterium]
MDISYKISAWNRNRKWKIFTTLFRIDENVKILDIGYQSIEYRDIDNYLEKHYPYPEKITALGIEEPTNLMKKYPKIKTIRYDGITFPFENKEFDIGWSNAVLEHVGDRNTQIHFLKEINRVCKSFFITTPNKFFPVEIHTKIPLLHFLLPERWFDIIIKLIGKSWATGNYMRLCSKKELKKMLAEAGITGYKIIENKLFLFTIDFVIYKI